MEKQSYRESSNTHRALVGCCRSGAEGRINRTARELHVAWDDLKRRRATTGEVPRQPARPAFVELVAPRAQSVCECTLEVEGRRGKLRIQLKGASISELASLSRALWETAS
jgi:hypothetical protein